MDLTTIRRRIEHRQITTPTELRRDVMNMFGNAMIFNGKESELYELSVKLKSTFSALMIQYQIWPDPLSKKTQADKSDPSLASSTNSTSTTLTTSTTSSISSHDTLPLIKEEPLESTHKSLLSSPITRHSKRQAYTTDADSSTSTSVAASPVHEPRTRQHVEKEFVLSDESLHEQTSATPQSTRPKRITKRQRNDDFVTSSSSPTNIFDQAGEEEEETPQKRSRRSVKSKK